ncbi:hypothetical protein QYE76_071932, partial [Lolium multiflorum]
MTRARVKALHDEVNSLLTTLDLGTPLDGLLPHADVLCVIRYKEHQGHQEEDTPWSKGGEEQLDKKMDMKMDMELDRKSPEERKEEKTDGRLRTRSTGSLTGPPGPQPGLTGLLTGPPGQQPGFALVTSGRHPGDLEPRPVAARSQARSETGPPERAPSVDGQQDHQFQETGKSKGKFKKGGKKAATPPMKPKNGPKPDAECYYRKEKGHWKRNFSKYLADLKSGLVKKKKEEMRNTFTIDTAGNTTTKRVAQHRSCSVPPTPATEEANDNDHETSNEETTEPRRSTRERATPDWYDPCLNVMIVDNNDEDPAMYEEAMMSPDSNKWQEAMNSEMGSMYDNKVWTLVDLPDSRKAVENKWIFKRKTDAD